MPRRKLDKIIFLDLEATCWGSKEDQGEQKQEIIEIGACFLNMKTGEPEQKTSYLIRPTQSTISEYCVNLTGITPEMIKSDGIPFEDAVNKFKKEFGPATRTWASWGAFDRVLLDKQCKSRNIKYPMGQNHINAKNLFALKYRLTRELGMIKALKYVNLSLEGNHHRADDDAWNSAKLLWKALS